MRCFCWLEEREPTEEHVFPEAIGGTLTIGRVCKPCNDFLGAKVDVLLTNHDLILIKRAEFGMIDRTGKVVNPLNKFLGVGNLANDSEKRIRLCPDPKTGRLEPRMMYHSTRTKLDDGTEAVQITLDESEIGEVGKILQREGKRAVLCVTHTASKYPSLTKGRFLLIDLTGGSSRSSALNDKIIRMSKRRP
jgi:HNH endonuclease